MILRRFACVVLLALLTGCGPSAPEAITFTPEHRSKPEKSMLTVTELLGPRGGKSGNIVAGTYIVRGKYDLTGTQFDHGLIGLSISGSYGLVLPPNPTDEQIMALSRPHIVIAKGQLTGTFELQTSIKDVKDGKGTISVSLFGNQKFDPERGGTTHETIDLK